MARQHMISSRKDVSEFLMQMKTILESDAFNLETDFVFQPREKDEEDDEYTNQATMLNLGYTTEDVVAELKMLAMNNYSETILDSVAPGFHRLFVFCKTIAGKDVYIKLGIKQKPQTLHEFVFCLSFHFARHPMTSFPYK